MNQIIMILLVSLLIIVHEIGHFFAARFCNVKVTRFGFGMPFGPSWKLFRWQDTDFYLHAFLFGGYVSFPDDEDEFDKDENNDEEEDTLPLDSPFRYENKTFWQKLFIVSAGVLMNVLFAIVLVIGCAAFYHKLPSQSQQIFVSDYIKNSSSNILQKDIQRNDRILKVNGLNIESAYGFTFFARNSKLFDDYAQKDLIKQNENELLRLNSSFNNIDEIVKKDTAIILPEPVKEEPLVLSRDNLRGLDRYKKSGVKLDEDIIELRNEIYSKRVYIPQKDVSLKNIALALSDTYKPMEITVLRDDKEVVLRDVMVGSDGLLGLKLKVQDVYYETKTFKDIILKSNSYIYNTTTTMLYSLWQLLAGKVSASDMHGVIAIVKLGGDIIASKGMLNGILLTAMISINLAIMNFLPIPALDGGHVMFLIIEKVTGKKPSREFEAKLNNFFITLLIVLMIAITYNDISAIVLKKF